MLKETGKSEDVARREYWALKLDEAHGFMMRALRHPVAECGEPLVALGPVAREAGVEVAFASEPHANGSPRRFVLRRGGIPGLIRAAEKMNRRGWILRIDAIIEDGGFLAYPYEFWHYSSGDAYECLLRSLDVTARYGPIDWNPETGDISPMADATEPLIDIENIADAIAAAINPKTLPPPV
ncbi:MAG: M15 family metallopeptidase [Kiritimatiellae bacterium]|nr:M15 family metallopeptidase [Kiritimatiellia bacterium]